MGPGCSGVCVKQDLKHTSSKVALKGLGATGTGTSPPTMATTTPNPVVMHDAFEPAQLTFSALEKNRAGGKQVFISREGYRGKVMIQTPEMHLPFGITPYQDAATGAIQSWSLDVSFRDQPEFVEAMRALDQSLVRVATERSTEWFGKAMSAEVVSEFTRKLVKEPNNPQYAPTMRVKIPCINGQETTKFYDAQSRQMVPLEHVLKGSTVKIIMELSPVWFLNKTVGISWKAVQVAVITRPARTIDEYAFVDDTGVGETATGETPLPEMAIEM